MPNRPNSIGTKSLRLLSIISNLPRSPQSTTCNDLHAALEQEGYVVDKRSIQRDLKQLLESREFGPLIECDDSSLPHRWSLSRDRQQVISRLDTSMAVVWDLVGRYVRPLLAPAQRSKIEPLVRRARDWLRNHDAQGCEPWSRRVAYMPRGLPLLPATVSPAVRDTVFDAALKGRQLEVVYGHASKALRLHPRAIVDRSQVAYLVASCGEHSDFRLYALHRIQRASQCKERINPLPFDLEAFVAEGALELPCGEMTDICLRFYHGAGDHLRETPLSTEQSFVDESRGVATVRARVRETGELRWWIQGFGANVEVLAPASLREAVGISMKQAAARY